MSRQPTAERSAGAFPQTDWELVEGAVECGGAGSALEGLLERYLPHLEAYLRGRFWLPFDQAEDLLQSFILEKVLQRDLLQNADRNRGRFRSFLLKSLHNYTVQRLRRDGADKRAAISGAISLDELPEQTLSADTSGAWEGFDVIWARRLLFETLCSMKRECLEGGRRDLWGVFEGRLLGPLLGEAAPVTYEVLVARFRFGSAAQAANALITAKRMFSRVLASLVATYVDGDESIEAEIHDLKEVLIRFGAGPCAYPEPADLGVADSSPGQSRLELEPKCLEVC
jgi:DNA-directed RNA polymerase specialized sigma24 family protein